MADYLEDGPLLPWNDADALAALLDERAGEIAAVIMEPIMLNAGSIPPRTGYLERVRELCSAHGIVLIFDEVITGFRVARGGASERFGVVPDLAVYGKALAGGWPVAAVAGSEALMARFGSGEVNHSGTFNASVMAMAAVHSTLSLLRDDPPYARIEQHGQALMAGIAELARSHDLPLRIQGLPVAFHASFGDDTTVFDYRDLAARDAARYAQLSRALAEAGVWVAGRGIWYVSAAHGQRELDVALSRIESAIRNDAGQSGEAR